MSFVLHGYLCWLFSSRITCVSSCNCTCPLPQSRRSKPAESTHLLAASVQGNELNLPCKIIFKSKGNYNFIVIPRINFGKKIEDLQESPHFLLFHLFKRSNFLLFLPTLSFLMCAFLSGSVYCVLLDFC